MNPKHKAPLLLLLLCSCSEAEGGSTDPSLSTPEPIPLVRVQQLAFQQVRQSIEVNSFLESLHRVTVLPKIAGRVQEVLVDESQAVHKGQVLARFDQREAESARQQVQVQLAERKLRHQLAELEHQASLRRIVQAEVERDRAKADHVRNKNIDQGLISPKQVEDSKFALDAAEEALKVAKFNASKAELEVSTAQNAIDEAVARLEAENLRLAEHTILSPIDGVIEQHMIRGGETVSASSELFVVVDRDRLVSYLRRPQRELPLLERAKTVSFRVESLPKRAFQATIDLISPVVDQSTGSVQVRIAVAPQDARLLRPGMFIDAKILTEDNRKALMVPKAALIAEIDRSVVFVVRDGTAQRLVVETGLETRETIECTNFGEIGLRAGDMVIVSGQQDLRDQESVEIAKD